MEAVGKYLMFLYTVVTARESFKTYLQLTLEECIAIGVKSVPLVMLVSVFMGAVTSMQIAQNLSIPWMGKFIVGLLTRNMSILELCPTMLGVIFAGKIGSSIASQLSSMRISEQIDALEIMGINTASYLVLPKIIATVLMYPMLVVISCFLTIYSGYLASVYAVGVTPEDFIYGVRFVFDPYMVQFSLGKSYLFAFFISSISAYKGFYASGGAVAIGRSSTQAVTNSCVAVLITDCILAQLY